MAAQYMTLYYRSATSHAAYQEEASACDSHMDVVLTGGRQSAS